MTPNLPAEPLEAAHPFPAPIGGGGRIRTFEGVSRQIYSLLPLATWVPLRENEPRILISGPEGVNESGATFAYALTVPPPKVALLVSLGHVAGLFSPKVSSSCCSSRATSRSSLSAAS